MKFARRPGGFECAECKRIHPKERVQVDHIVPVGPAPGSRNARGGETWDALIARLFCPVEMLQVLCTTCHLFKTSDDVRRANGQRPLF